MRRIILALAFAASLFGARADATIIKLVQQMTVQAGCGACTVDPSWDGQVLTATALLHTNDVLDSVFDNPLYDGDVIGRIAFGFDLLNLHVRVGNEALYDGQGTFRFGAHANGRFGYDAHYSFADDNFLLLFHDGSLSPIISPGDVATWSNPASATIVERRIFGLFPEIRGPNGLFAQGCTDQQLGNTTGCVDGTLRVIKVSEPGTTALFAIGLLGLASSRRTPAQGCRGRSRVTDTWQER